MALSEITHDSVLAAIREFDELGRDEFLAKYGFAKSKTYFLDLDGKRYDSKAIAGVAHGYSRTDLGALTSANFSGGEKTVKVALEKLGFEVKSEKNPNWTRDEHILALDYYFAHPNESHDDGKPSVIELSREIAAVGRLLGHSTSETFRNPNGVSMKLMNFRRVDPVYVETGRVGLQRGSKLEEVLWEEFFDDRVRLHALAENIRAWVADPSQFTDEGGSEPEVAEASEGSVLTRVHRYRERDQKIVKDKKTSFLKKHGSLFCEACGFDYSSAYGERGMGFIECHHTLPVSQMEPGAKTKLADLALLCANCHRMVHVKTPWLDMKELKTLVSCIDYSITG